MPMVAILLRMESVAGSTPVSSTTGAYALLSERNHGLCGHMPAEMLIDCHLRGGVLGAGGSSWIASCYQAWFESIVTVNNLNAA